jgi:hypothetical protein
MVITVREPERTFLDEVFAITLIGLIVNGPSEWPPRSPELTSCL